MRGSFLILAGNHPRLEPFIYPLPPADVSPDIIRPSAAFRKEVIRVTVTIILFVLYYLLLFLACAGVAAILGFSGIWLAISVHNVYAILLGIGLIGIGVLTLFFMIKFLFATKKEDVSGQTEITEQEYPELFAFIRRISQETGTDFPKHIYLSPEVNASVFYDSSFKSLLFPVKKNLVIGLGLVNMIDLSEFKAVIAHEFGHFSQKSMRAGSYVYHANKVIYNLLYENKGYNDLLLSMASLHRFFAFCVQITVKIVTAIQWLLQQAYRIVNKQYLRLSQQMEFHADAVSAAVTGSNNAIHALRRIELADHCYESVIAIYNARLADNYEGVNVYTQQRIMAGFLAVDYELPLAAEGLLLLHNAEKHYHSYSRVNTSNQWASHPTRAQREAALRALNVTGPVVETSSWILFPDAAALQETMTRQLYQTVQFKGERKPLTDELFTTRLEEERKDASYPAFYNGFYNNRGISLFTPDTTPASLIIKDIAAFFRETERLIPRIDAARTDLEVLDQIADPQNKVRSFDFDGQKYKRRNITQARQALQQDLEQQEQTLADQDKAVYCYYLQQATQQSYTLALRLMQYYSSYFTIRKINDDNVTACDHVWKLMEPFGRNQPINIVPQLNNHLMQGTALFKERVARIREEIANLPALNTFALPEETAAFLDYGFTFINNRHQFNGGELDKLVQYIRTFDNWSSELVFRAQKELLTWQLDMKEANTSIQQH